MTEQQQVTTFDQQVYDQLHDPDLSPKQRAEINQMLARAAIKQMERSQYVALMRGQVLAEERQAQLKVGQEDARLNDQVLARLDAAAERLLQEDLKNGLVMQQAAEMAREQIKSGNIDIDAIIAGLGSDSDKYGTNWDDIYNVIGPELEACEALIDGFNMGIPLTVDGFAAGRDDFSRELGVQLLAASDFLADPNQVRELGSCAHALLKSNSVPDGKGGYKELSEKNIAKIHQAEKIPGKGNADIIKNIVVANLPDDFIDALLPAYGAVPVAGQQAFMQQVLDRIVANAIPEPTRAEFKSAIASSPTAVKLCCEALKERFNQRQQLVADQEQVVTVAAQAQQQFLAVNIPGAKNALAFMERRAEYVAQLRSQLAQMVQWGLPTSSDYFAQVQAEIGLIEQAVVYVPPQQTPAVTALRQQHAQQLQYRQQLHMGVWHAQNRLGQNDYKGMQDALEFDRQRLGREPLSLQNFMAVNLWNTKYAHVIQQQDQQRMAWNNEIVGVLLNIDPEQLSTDAVNILAQATKNVQAQIAAGQLIDMDPVLSEMDVYLKQRQPENWVQIYGEVKTALDQCIELVDRNNKLNSEMVARAEAAFAKDLDRLRAGQQVTPAGIGVGPAIPQPAVAAVDEKLETEKVSAVERLSELQLQTDTAVSPQELEGNDLTDMLAALEETELEVIDLEAMDPDIALQELDKLLPAPDTPVVESRYEPPEDGVLTQVSEDLNLDQLLPADALDNTLLDIELYLNEQELEDEQLGIDLSALAQSSTATNQDARDSLNRLIGARLGQEFGAGKLKTIAEHLAAAEQMLADNPALSTSNLLAAQLSQNFDSTAEAQPLTESDRAQAIATVEAAITEINVLNHNRRYAEQMRSCHNNMVQTGARSEAMSPELDNELKIIAKMGTRISDWSKFPQVMKFAQEYNDFAIADRQQKIADRNQKVADVLIQQGQDLLQWGLVDKQQLKDMDGRIAEIAQAETMVNLGAQFPELGSMAALHQQQMGLRAQWAQYGQDLLFNFPAEIYPDIHKQIQGELDQLYDQPLVQTNFPGLAFMAKNNALRGAESNEAIVNNNRAVIKRLQEKLDQLSAETDYQDTSRSRRKGLFFKKDPRQEAINLLDSLIKEAEFRHDNYEAVDIGAMIAKREPAAVIYGGGHKKFAAFQEAYDQARGTLDECREITDGSKQMVRQQQKAFKKGVKDLKTQVKEQQQAAKAEQKAEKKAKRRRG